MSPERTTGKLGRLVAGGGRRLAPARARRFPWATVVVPAAVVGLFALVFTAANPLLARWAGAAWDALGAATGSLTVWRAMFRLLCALGSRSADPRGGQPTPGSPGGASGQGDWVHPWKTPRVLHAQIRLTSSRVRQ